MSRDKNTFLSNVVGKNVSQCNHHKKQCGRFFKKKKIELLYNSSNSKENEINIKNNSIFIYYCITINDSQFMKLTSISTNGWMNVKYSIRGLDI